MKSKLAMITSRSSSALIPVNTQVIWAMAIATMEGRETSSAIVHSARTVPTAVRGSYRTEPQPVLSASYLTPAIP